MKQRTKVLFLVCLALVSALFGYAVYRFSSLVMAPPRTTPVSVRPSPTPTPVPTPSPTPTPVPTPTPEPYHSPIDFDALWRQNEHIYAWIELPDTWLSYPILQHPTQDTYYLNRTVDGHDGYPGSIFTYPLEGQDFDQFNTVIYGHNMMDGSMFGNLKNFRSASYMREHRTLTIYTPTAQLDYTIFAAVTYDDRLIPANYDDRSPADCEAYLESVFSCSDGTFLRDDLTLDSRSHIVTLSTCIGGMPYNRLLVLGVLKEETT